MQIIVTYLDIFSVPVKKAEDIDKKLNQSRHCEVQWWRFEPEDMEVYNECVKTVVNNHW